MHYAKHIIWKNPERWLAQLEADGSVTFAEDITAEELRWAVQSCMQDHELNRQRRLEEARKSGVMAEWARDRYERHVQEFLDDPVAGEEVPTYRELLAVGEVLGLDFWKVAGVEGTPFEIKRLKDALGMGE